jgi:hypothetical protein
VIGGNIKVQTLFLQSAQTWLANHLGGMLGQAHITAKEQNEQACPTETERRSETLLPNPQYKRAIAVVIITQTFVVLGESSATLGI